MPQPAHRLLHREAAGRAPLVTVELLLRAEASDGGPVAGEGRAVVACEFLERAGGPAGESLHGVSAGAPSAVTDTEWHESFRIYSAFERVLQSPRMPNVAEQQVLRQSASSLHSKLPSHHYEGGPVVRMAINAARMHLALRHCQGFGFVLLTELSVEVTHKRYG